MDHPVIREARKNGNTIFVIATLYEAERCNIQVVFSKTTDDVASAAAEASAAGVPIAGGGVGGDMDDTKSFMKGKCCIECEWVWIHPLLWPHGQWLFE